MTTPVRFALVGYGLGGRLFHAPFINASPECELSAIVARSQAAAERARADHPDALVVSSLEALSTAQIDAVTVSTPPETRVSLVTAALASGWHVVSDKPFAPTAEDARALAAEAARRGLVLNAYHNRRNDPDIVTARALIRAGTLGVVERLEIRCDQDAPETLEYGPGGGLLRDLGSHVVDQARYLLGPISTVSASMAWRGEGPHRTDTSFIVTLIHEGGATSVVSASKANFVSSREIRVLGTEGSYSSDYSDVQYEALSHGDDPSRSSETWGLESSDRWGLARTSAREWRVPSERGSYTDYYSAFAHAVRAGGPGPVPADHAVEVVAALDAARRSAEQGGRYIALINV